MRNDLPPEVRSAWHAALQLRYANADGRTALSERRHEGPLRVQKSLYPEGPAICHSILLHPPAGIVGGDTLRIEARVDAQAHAVLTTPGAGKWYRSAGPLAAQSLAFAADAGAVLEWLPQETILFAGAHVDMRTDIRLAEDARYLGWEIVCLGRPAAGERFAAGSVRHKLEIRIGAELVWCEQAKLEGDDPRLQSVVALAGHPVYATFVAVGPVPSAPLLTALRGIDAGLAVTALDRAILLRYLGPSTEAARARFIQARALLRPALCNVPDHPLRIWRT